MPSSLACTLERKALWPPTLIPRKKTIKAMLPIVAHRSIEEKRKRSRLTIDNVWPSLPISVNSPNHMLGRIRNEKRPSLPESSRPQCAAQADGTPDGPLGGPNGGNGR